MISAFYICLALATIAASNPLTRVARDGQVQDLETSPPSEPPSTCSTGFPYYQTKIGNLTNYANIYHDLEDMMPRANCSAWKSYTPHSGLFRISPNGGCEFKVYCDMCLSEGEGWIVIQRRRNDDVAFETKEWEDYKTGFGDYLGNYWIGLEKLHEITSTGNYTLYIGFQLTIHNSPRYAYYSEFSIDSEENDYKLRYLNCFGNNTIDALALHNGDAFSTGGEHDNDEFDSTAEVDIDCASHSGLEFGGWWFGAAANTNTNEGKCFRCNLNGKYGGTANGIKWEGQTTTHNSLRYTVMAIRRVNYP